MSSSSVSPFAWNYRNIYSYGRKKIPKVDQNNFLVAMSYSGQVPALIFNSILEIKKQTLF